MQYSWTRLVKRTEKLVSQAPHCQRDAEFVMASTRPTGWGDARIIGELRKLGIEMNSQRAGRNILKEENIVPAPD